MSASLKSLITLAVPSRTELVDKVCQMFSDFFANLGFAEDDVYAFDLSLREAVVNAMKHGNGSDPTLTVSVLAEVIGGDCVIRVRDSGKNRAAVLESHASLFAPNGRGLVIMRSLMDSVEVARKGYGCEVVLRKRVGTTSGPLEKFPLDSQAHLRL